MAYRSTRENREAQAIRMNIEAQGHSRRLALFNQAEQQKREWEAEQLRIARQEQKELEQARREQEYKEAFGWNKRLKFAGMGASVGGPWGGLIGGAIGTVADLADEYKYLRKRGLSAGKSAAAITLDSPLVMGLPIFSAGAAMAGAERGKDGWEEGFKGSALANFDAEQAADTAKAYAAAKAHYDNVQAQKAQSGERDGPGVAANFNRTSFAGPSRQSSFDTQSYGEQLQAPRDEGYTQFGNQNAQDLNLTFGGELNKKKAW